MSGKDHNESDTSSPHGKIDMDETLSLLQDLHTPRPELFQRLHQIPQEHPMRRPLWPRLAAVLVPATCLAVLALMWLPPTHGPRTGATPGYGKLRQKGSVWRALYAHAGQGTIETQELRSMTVLHPGDLLQFVHDLKAGRFVFVVGTTADGKIYPLHPIEGQRSVWVAAGHGSLPRVGHKHGSFQLDQYIGLERFFVLTSERPFTWQDVKRAFQRQWSTHTDLKTFTRLKGHWQCFSFLIEKRHRLVGAPRTP